MRRHLPQVVAALAAGGVVALCLVVVGVASAGSRSDVVAAGGSSVPSDVVWRWVQHCMDVSGETSSAVPMNYSRDDDGRLTVEFGWVDDQGHMTIDPRMAAATNDCLHEKTVEFSGWDWRSPNPAERLELYDWARRSQQPCLAARGIETELASLDVFLDEQTAPWYLLDQLDWSELDRDLDFDTLLAARLACPPMPAYLAAQGVGW